MTVDDSEQIRIALRDFMAARGLSAYKWTRSAGVSYNVLRNFLAGDSNALTTATLAKLAAAAGTRAAELLPAGPTNQTKTPSRLDETLFLQAVAAAQRLRDISPQVTDQDIASTALYIYLGTERLGRKTAGDLNKVFEQAVDLAYLYAERQIAVRDPK